MMNILHVNVFDVYGGGETIMCRLAEGANEQGHRASVLVRERMGEGLPFPVSVFNHDSRRSDWARAWRDAGSWLMDGPGKNRKWVRGVSRFLSGPLAEPLRAIRRQAGYEDFEYPDTRHAIQRADPEPDVIHIHCFHGKYFDLRELEEISRWKPVVVTLHDAWMFTGHCAYPGECGRFQVGCGSCPDLKRYPSIPRDKTAQNFRRKREIYSRSRLNLVAPSRWMMDQLELSAMKGCFDRQRVIPNGIDTDFFYPGDRAEARADWEEDEKTPLLLYVARNARTSPYKDFKTVCLAAEEVADRRGGKVRLLVLGDEGDPDHRGNLSIHFETTTDLRRIRSAYRACDIYLHAASAENFPTTVIEAMACGRPVVATRTGGIPEQVIEGTTGFLVNLKDSKMMAKRIWNLLEDETMRTSMGSAARQRARDYFSSTVMISQYMSFYETITTGFAKKAA